MGLKQQLEQQINLLGATFELDDSTRMVSLCITSPDGMVWKANQCHSIDGSVFKNKGSRDYLYRSALEDVVKGVEPCEIGAMCDFCNPIDEDGEV